MRTKLGIAAALALSAIAIPSAAQAQDYYGYGGYDYGRGYDRYDGYDRHEWREHRRWERERAREARRAHYRWMREHRGYGYGYDRDYAWNPYR